MFCVEDRTILCPDCDDPIHSANDLTAKHTRFLLVEAKLSAALVDQVPPPLTTTTAAAATAPPASPTLCPSSARRAPARPRPRLLSPAA